MIRLYKNGNNVDSKVVEYIADTEADLNELPTDIASGSICIILQGSSGSATVKMLGNDKAWHDL